LYSYDWRITNPPPQCGSGNWCDKPKEAMVCNIVGCPDGCCYHIIYYDRWTGTNENEYEISIVGIYYSGAASCNTCSKDYLANAAYFPLLQQISLSDPQFRTKTMSTQREPFGTGTEENGTFIFIYYPANCKNSNGEQCLFESKCCKRKYGISFGGYGYPDYVVTAEYCNFELAPIITPTSPACLPPCQIVCNDIPFSVDPDPCSFCNENYTWKTVGPITIPVKCCPDCPDIFQCDGCSFTTSYV